MNFLEELMFPNKDVDQTAFADQFKWGGEVPDFGNHKYAKLRNTSRRLTRKTRESSSTRIIQHGTRMSERAHFF
jgi:hypothetical protein